MIPKPIKVRLHGKAKTELRDAIFERDNHHCVICGTVATDWHHTERGCNKSDRLETGVALCHECHMALHFDAKKSERYKRMCEIYLEDLKNGK